MVSICAVHRGGLGILTTPTCNTRHIHFEVAITEWGADIVHVCIEPVEAWCFVPISDTMRRLRTVPTGMIFRAAQAVPFDTSLCSTSVAPIHSSILAITHHQATPLNRPTRNGLEQPIDDSTPYHAARHP
jgi:hypothetical protein